MSKFKLHSPYQPAGDQPAAIKQLVLGLEKNMRRQTLLGVTGSGKTFTMANVIEQTQLPTLVIAHNKTLAAQLCNEFREFFPDNAVEYFVSYYDYYQPEAYLAASDTYIEKEAMINEEIDRLRHACTQALLTRRDVIIVASVSAIYNLGSPAEYMNQLMHLTRGQKLDRRGMTQQLIQMQFERTNSDLKRGQFRLRGQVFEIIPMQEEIIYRFEVSDKIDRIEMVDAVTRKVKCELEDAYFFPAKHYVAPPHIMDSAFVEINRDLEARLAEFEAQGKVLEYERLKRRTRYDLEMIKNIGYCNGIENYSRYFDGRAPGAPPYALLEYFRQGAKSKEQRANKFLTVIDESHVTVPQIRGMYNGDRARKDILIEHGFRLPSARDNRPLRYEEFDAKVDKVVYVSATPDEYELGISEQVVEQIVRPTGLIDPEIVVRPVMGGGERGKGKGERGTRDGGQGAGLSQIEDLMIRIEERVKIHERVLVTTLTKKMAEDLTEYLEKKKIKVKYLHSDIDTVERIEIITELRQGKIDVIVGVNLLREGLDLPEVSLVAILDADKEGFLRSATSLIQTIGRAARNVNGQVLMYADTITKSIKKAISETDRRRAIQIAYNKEHGITPKTIEKSIRNILEEFGITRKEQKAKSKKQDILKLDLIGDGRPVEVIIKDKENQMRQAAKDLEFELAAILRDEIGELKKSSIIKKKNKSLIVPTLLFLMMVASLFFPLATLAEDAVVSTQAQLEQQLKDIEAQIAQFEKELSVTKTEKTTLANKIKQLQAQQKTLTLQIKETSLKINSLSSKISVLSNDINSNIRKQQRIDAEMALVIRQINQVDNNILVALFMDGGLTSFSNQIKNYAELTDSLMALQLQNQALKNKLTGQRTQMEDQKSDADNLLKIKSIQQQGLKNSLGEQNQLLVATKGKESNYQAMLSDSKKRAAEIRSRIYELFNTGKQINFGQAVDIAKWVSSVTGVRAAFVLAVLTQESNLGKNVGTCNRAGDPPEKSWTVIMKPERDQEPFKTITSELGFDIDTTPVSCPMRDKNGKQVGWGGAMGPAQFIPSTWMGYRAKVTKHNGKTTANPWDIRDAFLASAIKLTADGADGTDDGDWKAAMKYFAGSVNLKYRFYGDNVLATTKKYLADISEL